MKNDDFLRAIIANPDDDAPRLIYADWLDEHGNAPRAEFIRLQIALARMNRDDPALDAHAARVYELEDTYRDEWQAELPDLPERMEWDYLQRGFFSGVTANPNANLLHAAPMILATIPFEGLHLTLYTSDVVDLSLLSLVPHTKHLCVSQHNSNADVVDAVNRVIAMLFGTPRPLPFVSLEFGVDFSAVSMMPLIQANLPQVRELYFRDGPHSHSRFDNWHVEQLAQAKWLVTLRELSLQDTFISGTAYQTLATHVPADCLRHLDLQSGLTADAEAISLIDSGLMHRIKSMYIPRIQIGLDTWSRFLAACPPTLVQHIEHLYLGDAGLVTLAQSPVLAQMTTLPDFGGGITDVGVRALAATKYGTRLERMRLNAAHSSEGLAELFASTAFPMLRSCSLFGAATEQITLPAYRHAMLRQLELDMYRLYDHALAVFCAASDLPALEVLALNECDLGSHSARALANAAGFPKLRELNLNDNPLGEEGLIALLSGTGMPALEELRVFRCGMTVGVLHAWQQSPRLAQMKSLWTDYDSEADEESYAVYCAFREHAWSLGCSVDGWAGS